MVVTLHAYSMVRIGTPWTREKAGRMICVITAPLIWIRGSREFGLYNQSMDLAAHHISRTLGEIGRGKSRLTRDPQAMRQRSQSRHE